MISAPVATAAPCAYGGGTGTAADPYQVSTPAHLECVRSTPADWTKAFRQTGSISMSGATWTSPIGTSAQEFTGTYDGNGFVISDLTISMSSVRAGLFGYLVFPGTIKNLGFTGLVSAAGTPYVGGLVGESFYGTVIASYTTGSVSGGDSVGGLIGYNNMGTVTSSYATGAVNGIDNVGGLIGRHDGSVSTSFATGVVTASRWVAGGLIGIANSGSVTNAYARGQVLPPPGPADSWDPSASSPSPTPTPRAMRPRRRLPVGSSAP